MHVEFQTKDMQEAVKAIKKIFSKGPLGDNDKDKSKEEDNKDCLVASKEDGFIIESARFGLYCRAKINSSVEQEGKFVISRFLLSESQFDGETTVFKVEKENKLDVRSGRLKTKFMVNHESDMILAQKPNTLPGIKFSIPCEVLRQGLKHLEFTPTIQKGKMDLKLQILLKGKSLVMTTNDSYRAIMFSADLDEEIPEALIVTTCPFFSSVISSIPTDAKVEIGYNDKGLRIKGGNLDVYQPALQSMEPVDVQGHVNKRLAEKPKMSCLVSASEARNAIESVSSFVPSSFGEIKLGLVFNAKGKVTATVDSSLGEGNFQLDVQDVEINDGNEAFVSSRYISECLSLVGGDVQLRILEKEVMIVSESNRTVLVMPQIA